MQAKLLLQHGFTRMDIIAYDDYMIIGELCSKNDEESYKSDAESCYVTISISAFKKMKAGCEGYAWLFKKCT